MIYWLAINVIFDCKDNCVVDEINNKTHFM